MFDIHMTLGRDPNSSIGVTDLAKIRETMQEQAIEKAFVSSLLALTEDDQYDENVLSFFSSAVDDLRPLPVFESGEQFDRWVKYIQTLGVQAVIMKRVSAFAIHEDSFSARMKKLVDAHVKAIFLPIRAHYLVAKSLNAWSGIFSICKAYKSMRFVVTCMNRGDANGLFSTMAECENLYADVGNLHTASMIERLVDQGYVDRLMLGSGYGVCYPFSFADMVRFCGISNAAKSAILYNNAQRIFDEE